MTASDLLVSVLRSAGRAGFRPGTLLRGGTARRSAGRTSARLALAVLLVSIAAATAPMAAAGSNPTAPVAPAAAPPTQQVCAPAAPGYASCLSLLRTDIAARTKALITALATTPSGYGPADLQSAYALPGSSAGTGRTVAIVDAYDQPNAASDLAAYRAQYGLPACAAGTAATACFRKVNQSGASSPLPAKNSGWGVEISLDIEMVSAICPNCQILLVEANSNSYADLGAAVNRAVAMGAVAVSNSYGGGEGSSETSYDTSYFNHPGVAITASSGDSGYGVEYPAASRYVVAVGGTTLSKANTTQRGWTETAWSGAGSGCSAYESKPAWQADSGCARRSVADVSAVADPSTGVAVYDSYNYGGWLVVGGTSVASPIIASTYALAGTPASGTYPASYLYANPALLNDVTSGSNGSCGGSYLCTAGTGYDGPTGLGTPNGTGAFTAPAATLPGVPTNVTATAGNGQATVSFSPPASNGGSPIISYTVTSTPGGVTAIGTASPITVTGLTNGTAYTFTVHATNSVGNGPESSPSNSVTPAAVPLTITTTSLAAGRLTRSYSATIQATGGVSPYTWTIASGSLPPGLKLGSSTGTISGTPTSTGTYSFTVSVSDSATSTRQTASRAFSITISRR
jgi:subtilase family serine protease